MINLRALILVIIIFLLAFHIIIEGELLYSFKENPSFQKKNVEKRQRDIKAYLITFYDDCCANVTSIPCCSTGMQTGRFVSCRIYNRSELELDAIVQKEKGNGYWIWKPYIIFKTLISNSINYGDIVMYSDAERRFIGDPLEYWNILWRKANKSLYEENKLYREIYNSMEGQDFFAFSKLGSSENQWIKNETLEIIAGMKSKEWKENFWKTPAASGSFFIARKSIKSIRFAAEWLTYSWDERLVTGVKDQVIQNNTRTIEKRYEDSILSILLKKWELYFVICPGIASNDPQKKKYEEAGFNQFME
jgi:hypothetical protein